MQPNSPPSLTTAVGTPMANDRNTVATGPRSPVLFDYQPREKMGRFNCKCVLGWWYTPRARVPTIHSP